MEQGISEIFGEGVGEGGRRLKVYRALRKLLCSACGASIASGTLFTRKEIEGVGLRVLPRCAACDPFELEADKPKSESELLRNLLAPETETRDEIEKPRAIPRADVESRLGPALSRARRNRNKRS